MNKSIKSIIGKLSREAYIKKQSTKQRQARYLLQNLSSYKDCDLLEIDSSKITGLEKAPKQDIKYLYEVLGGSDG